VYCIYRVLWINNLSTVCIPFNNIGPVYHINVPVQPKIWDDIADCHKAALYTDKKVQLETSSSFRKGANSIRQTSPPIKIKNLKLKQNICIAPYNAITYSPLKRSRMTRVNKGSYSFTWHPHTHVYQRIEWASLPLLSSRTVHRTFAGTNFPSRRR